MRKVNSSQKDNKDDFGRFDFCGALQRRRNVMAFSKRSVKQSRGFGIKGDLRKIECLLASRAEEPE